MLKDVNVLQLRPVAKPKKPVASLSRHADFLTLRAEGKTLHVNAWLLINFRSTDTGQLRCGWTIPRQIGTAVVRNRLRRWGREFFRLRIKKLKEGLDINLVFKRREPGFYSSMSHKELDEALEKMVKKLGLAVG